ncbi:MAG: hypothetical protein O9972_52955 [Burkholderiales bacterium]|nr:hypothetical protein [Burkholderiales bacterium]
MVRLHGGVVPGVDRPPAIAAGRPPIPPRAASATGDASLGAIADPTPCCTPPRTCSSPPASP